MIANGPVTDKSGSTHATPGTSTLLAAANPSRKYLFIQNLDAAATLHINFTSDAHITNAGSIKIGPGLYFAMDGSYICSESINVAASSASVKFTAKEGA